MKKAPLLPTISSSLVLTTLVLMTSACTGPDYPKDMMAEEVGGMGGRNTGGERPVAMRGEGTFAEGKVVAVATISRGFERVGSQGGTPAGGRGGSSGSRRRVRDEDIYFGDSEEEQKAAVEAYIRQINALKARGSPMPPVTLRVSIENKGTAPMVVEVTEVNSSLGNFAVRPPQLTIAPGEIGTLQPMISQLGVTSDDIPLKLAVRVGGKVESQVINVKNVLADSLRK